MSRVKDAHLLKEWDLLAIFLVIFLGCSKTPEALPEIKPEGVPEMCQPYIPQESFIVPESENMEFEGTTEREVCWAYPGHKAHSCQTFSMVNAANGDRDAGAQRMFMGFICQEPYKADRVTCIGEAVDMDGNQWEEVTAVCPGDRLCENCCEITKREPKFIPAITFTPEEHQAAEIARCKRLQERKALCTPFCQPGAKTASQCNTWWAYTCKDEP